MQNVLVKDSLVTWAEPCAQTRIRLQVQDSRMIDEAMLKEKGVAAVVRIDDALLHLLAGLNADQYAAEMSAQLAA